MLEVTELTGGYMPQKPIIKNLSFSVQSGEIVGLIGLNGAGKSTTIKNILGLLVPFSGSVRVHGKTWGEDPIAFRSHISFIPETPQFYPELTLWEHLTLTAKAYGISEEDFKERTEQLLPMFRMEKYKTWFPDTFSKGMQQKIMILCAFLTRPSLLILDEPFVGLDPLAIQSLLQLLEESKRQGMGILMSTHILTMAEKHCDRFLLLHEGKIRLYGTLEEMREQANRPLASLEDLFLEMTR